MKNYYLFVFLLLIPCFAQAQIVGFGDNNFKMALVSTNCVDTDGDGIFDSDADINDDGEIQVSEAEQISSLNIRGRGISSLTDIEHFVNLVKLDCSLNDLVVLDVNDLEFLEELKCFANDIQLVLLDQLENIRILDLTANDLQTIDVTNLVELEELLVQNNSLEILDVSQNINLTYLSCANNQLTTLDVSNLSQLDLLTCSRNFLNSLDNSSNPALTGLVAGGNNITELNLANESILELLNMSEAPIESIDLSGFTNLEHLDFSDTLLTEIDVTQNLALKELDVENVTISSLDLSQNTLLEVLDCSGSLINILDVNQNQNLIQLDCSNTPLESLDLSQNSLLGVLDIENVALDVLDLSQNTNLYNLNIENNNFTELDLQQNLQLSYVSITNSLLTDIDLSNHSLLQYLGAFDNGLLEFVNLKNGGYSPPEFVNNPLLSYVCIDDSEVDFMEYFYEEGTLPYGTYCSFTPGGNYFALEGQNRFDLLQDGCSDVDIDYAFLKFDIANDSGNQAVFSNATGTYALYFEEGINTVTPILENSDYFSVTPNDVTLNIPSDGDNVEQDFCITANGNFDDLEVYIIPLDLARPGFDANYRISCKNKGTTVLSGSVTLQFDDNYMAFLSANPAADSSSSGSLQWNFTDLEPFETREITYVMNLNTPTDADFPLNSDDVLEFVVDISATEADETPEDNTFILNQIVVNSFDPNDKRCLEGETITLEMVGRYVHYMIRFENTGTANAINVVVRDEIDTSKFDISTLVPLNASHDFVTRIQNTNEVEFIFENIDLPFDDANNDGFVVFKIKTLESLALGDNFSNDAEIYFDFNAPIITNDFVTSVEENLSVSDIDLNDQVSIYPNPVNSLLHINSRQPMESATIYDINGRLLQEVQFSEAHGEQYIDVQELNQGVYMVKLNSTVGESIQKFIKN